MSEAKKQKMKITMSGRNYGASLMRALHERSMLDPDAPNAIAVPSKYLRMEPVKYSRMIGNELEELTPDWEQIYLNGGPPCFAVTEGDHRFCNRSERWQGHPSDHKFVSWTDFLFEVMMWGQNAHASHTAAIREKAEALVAKHIEVCEADVFEMNFGDGAMMTGMTPKDIYQIGYAAALFGLGPELTALKAELDKEQR